MTDEAQAGLGSDVPDDAAPPTPPAPPSSWTQQPQPGSFAPPAQPGYAPMPGYPPTPGYATPSGYPPQPGFFAPAPYPAAGWVAPQAGAWSATAAYRSPAWGVAPGYWLAALPPPGPAIGLQWGGMAVRLGALLIDAVIVVGSEIALSLVLESGRSSAGGVSGNTAVGLSFLWWLFALAYYPACWYFFGSTLGQKVLGLRVVRASDGLPPAIGAILVRFLIFFMVTIIFPIGIISGIEAATEPHKRAWHDVVARTVVVRLT